MGHVIVKVCLRPFPGCGIFLVCGSWSETPNLKFGLAQSDGMPAACQRGRHLLCAETRCSALRVLLQVQQSFASGCVFLALAQLQFHASSAGPLWPARFLNPPSSIRVSA